MPQGKILRSFMVFNINPQIIQSEQGKSDLMDQVAKLEAERSALEKLCSELKQKTEQLERRAAELRAAEEKRHQEELLALKKTNAQLKVFQPLHCLLKQIVIIFVGSFIII